MRKMVFTNKSQFIFKFFAFYPDDRMPLKRLINSRNRLTSIISTPKSMMSATSIVGRTPLHNNNINININTNSMQTLQLLQRNSVFSLISPSNKLRGSIVFSELSGFSQQTLIKQMVIEKDSFYDKV